MKELEVLGVRVEMPTNHPIVLLRERDGDRYLPIWIGAAEATAIAYAQQGVEPPRPLTHDLMINVLEALGHRLVEIQILSMQDDVFFAELVVDGGTTISARPSDAIALALRVSCPIRADEGLLESVGVTMADEQEDEVERFREFLDSVTPEDFEAEHTHGTGDGDVEDPTPRDDDDPPSPSTSP